MTVDKTVFLPILATTMVNPGMMKDKNVDIIVMVGVKLATHTELSVEFCVTFDALSSSLTGSLLITTVTAIMSLLVFVVNCGTFLKPTLIRSPSRGTLSIRQKSQSAKIDHCTILAASGEC